MWLIFQRLDNSSNVKYSIALWTVQDYKVGNNNSISVVKYSMLHTFMMLCLRNGLVVISLTEMKWITVITERSRLMWTHFEGLRTKLLLTAFYDFLTRHFKKFKVYCTSFMALFYVLCSLFFVLCSMFHFTTSSTTRGQSNFAWGRILPTRLCKYWQPQNVSFKQRCPTFILQQ